MITDLEAEQLRSLRARVARLREAIRDCLECQDEDELADHVREVLEEDDQ